MEASNKLSIAWKKALENAEAEPLEAADLFIQTLFLDTNYLKLKALKRTGADDKDVLKKLPFYQEVANARFGSENLKRFHSILFQSFFNQVCPIEDPEDQPTEAFILEREVIKDLSEMVLGGDEFDFKVKLETLGKTSFYFRSSLEDPKMEECEVFALFEDLVKAETAMARVFREVLFKKDCFWKTEETMKWVENILYEGMQERRSAGYADPALGEKLLDFLTEIFEKETEIFDKKSFGGKRKYKGILPLESNCFDTYESLNVYRDFTTLGASGTLESMLLARLIPLCLCKGKIYNQGWRGKVALREFDWTVGKDINKKYLALEMAGNLVKLKNRSNEWEDISEDPKYAEEKFKFLISLAAVLDEFLLEETINFLNSLKLGKKFEKPGRIYPAEIAPIKITLTIAPDVKKYLTSKVTAVFPDLDRIVVGAGGHAPRINAKEAQTADKAFKELGEEVKDVVEEINEVLKEVDAAYEAKKKTEEVKEEPKSELLDNKEEAVKEESEAPKESEKDEEVIIKDSKEEAVETPVKQEI